MAITMLNDDNSGIPEALERGVTQDIALDLIDPSTRYLRMSPETQGRRFEELRASIASQGQISPVILRPNPTKPGRYETVTGHRRIAALNSLGLGSTARAIVADLDDYQALLVSGMDNTTNKALTYAEKIWHSNSLDQYSWSSKKADVDRLSLDALSLRPGELVRLREIRRAVSIDVLEAIGPAPGIGKDLWWKFALKIAEDRINHLERLRVELASADFQNLPMEQRFERARSIVGVGKLQQRTITADGKESLLGKITERRDSVSVNVGTRTMASIVQSWMPVLRECEANADFAAYMKDVLATAKADFDAIQQAMRRGPLPE